MHIKVLKAQSCAKRTCPALFNPLIWIQNLYFMKHPPGSDLIKWRKGSRWRWKLEGRLELDQKALYCTPKTQSFFSRQWGGTESVRGV